MFSCLSLYFDVAFSCDHFDSVCLRASFKQVDEVTEDTEDAEVPIADKSLQA